MSGEEEGGQSGVWSVGERLGGRAGPYQGGWTTKFVTDSQTPHR